DERDGDAVENLEVVDVGVGDEAEDLGAGDDAGGEVAGQLGQTDLLEDGAGEEAGEEEVAAGQRGGGGLGADALGRGEGARGLHERGELDDEHGLHAVWRSVGVGSSMVGSGACSRLSSRSYAGSSARS